MGFFGSSGKISKSEFSKVCSKLRSRGLSRDNVDDVKKIFGGEITREGAERGIRWLREHPSSHHLSPQHISVLNEELKKRL